MRDHAVEAERSTSSGRSCRGEVAEMDEDDDPDAVDGQRRPVAEEVDGQAVE